MDHLLKPGIELTLEMKVEKKDLANSVGSGSLDVLSTPSLIAFMEKTAMESVARYLGPGKSTVGILVNVRHLKPSLPGEKIICKSKLVDVDGKKLSFSVEASGSQGLIGTGSHERYIIEVAGFMEKLKRPV
ncbi:MAG: thioesterase family protein [Bacteroidales bacterium]